MSYTKKIAIIPKSKHMNPVRPCVIQDQKEREATLCSWSWCFSSCFLMRSISFPLLFIDLITSCVPSLEIVNKLLSLISSKLYSSIFITFPTMSFVFQLTVCTLSILKLLLSTEQLSGKVKDTMDLVMVNTFLSKRKHFDQ